MENLATVLPTSLVEVAEEIGLINCLALAALYGGQEVYISRLLGEEHLIVQVFGREVADRLSFRFGGGTISLAKGDRVSRETRNEAIVAARGNTKVAALARKYHLSERAVWGILSSHKKRNRRVVDQLSLFEVGS